MIINEWEIWHTYSTYLEQRIVDLDAAAHALVNSGLAYCAMTREGRTYWRATSGTRSGLTSIEMNAANSQASIHLETDDAGPPEFENFAREAWAQASHFRFNELRQFGYEADRLPASYVRAFLGQCNLISEEEDRTIICYPVLKIHQTGVVIFEIRIIAPDRVVPIGEFIDRFVNLHRTRFDRLDVPVAFARLGPLASMLTANKKSPFYLRAYMLYRQRMHERSLPELTYTYESEDFSFELVSLRVLSGKKHTLSSFAEYVIDVVAHGLSRPRFALSLLFGNPKRSLRRGDYWSGRPHIYLIDHEHQQNTASANEAKHRDAYGWILARHWGGEGLPGASYLPKSSRALDDFGAYITLAASLWVWSKDGIREQSEWEDVNRGHLIYESQAVVETLEYGHMLHYRLLDYALDRRASSAVFQARQDLILVRQQMDEISHFGETRGLLREGWEAMGVPALRDRIAETLGLREAESAVREAQAINRRNALIGILFGIVAVPPLATEVIAPLLAVFDLWTPPDPALAKLYVIGIAIAFTLILLMLIWIFTGADGER